MKIKILNFILVILCASSGTAKVVLPDIISNNMVLQQDAQVRLWGKALPNGQIVVTVSWNSQKFTTLSDKEGNWEIGITTPRGSYIQKYQMARA